MEIVKSDLARYREMLGALHAREAVVEEKIEALEAMLEPARVVAGEGCSDSVAPDEAPKAEPRPRLPIEDREQRRAPSTLTSSTPPRRVDVQSLDRRVLEVVRDRGPIARRDIAAALGVSTPQLKRPLARLKEAGSIVGTGNTKQRLYSLSDGDPRAAKAHASAAANAQAQQRRLNGVVLRDRLMTAIKSDPGDLTEERLALALNVDREEVAFQCGKLLLDAKVVFNPDKTYSPA